jgi:hypothetical protein
MPASAFSRSTIAVRTWAFRSSAAASRTADCEGQAPRRERAPLASSPDLATLKRWLRGWTAVRHCEAAERTLLTAIAAGASPEALASLLVDAETDRTAGTRRKILHGRHAIMVGQADPIEPITYLMTYRFYGSVNHCSTSVGAGRGYGPASSRASFLASVMRASKLPLLPSGAAGRS